MNPLHARAYSIGIHQDQTCFILTMEDLLDVIEDSMDTSKMTDDELKEAITLAKKAADKIDWYLEVKEALNNVSYGGSQVGIAKAGGYPCEKCPDCFLTAEGWCRNDSKCTAWDIYSNQY